MFIINCTAPYSRVIIALRPTVKWKLHWNAQLALNSTVLSLHLDDRRGVQENTSLRSKEFLRAKPEGTHETECRYFPVLPDLSHSTDIIQFLKVMYSTVHALGLVTA